MVARAQDVLTDPSRNLRRDLRDPRQIGTFGDVPSAKMPHLHLPADHDEHDRDLAAALARALRSRELYVTWSEARGGARPVILTACEPPRPRRRGLARLLGALAPRRT